MNAVSDVVENRPRPLRRFDQIFMKSGDMLRQAEVVANWAKDGRLAFIGDGDGISVTVAHLMQEGILGFGPKQITVFDFDERIVNSVKRFAARRLMEGLEAELYNVADPFPETGEYDFFYTNPPWGQHSEGGSVTAFAERGIEAVGYQGQGMVVIADDQPSDPEVTWPQQVLLNTQVFALGKGFFIARMMPRESLYHLNDEHSHFPSCNLILSSLAQQKRDFKSKPLSAKRRENFYGRGQPLDVRYVRERTQPDERHADEREFYLEKLS